LPAKLRHNSRVHLIAPLTLFDPLLSGAALVVEGDDSLGRTFRGYSLANQMRQCRVRGDEGQFARRRLSGRSAFSEETFARAHGNERAAPIADLPALASERGGSTYSCRSYSPRHRHPVDRKPASADLRVRPQRSNTIPANAAIFRKNSRICSPNYANSGRIGIAICCRCRSARWRQCRICPRCFGRNE